jgi:hypothetical protein
MKTTEKTAYPDRNTYKLVRVFRGEPGRLDWRRRTLDTGLTRNEVHEHCNDPETSSSTCTGRTAKARTRKYGDWFDTFEVE